MKNLVFSVLLLCGFFLPIFSQAHFKNDTVEFPVNYLDSTQVVNSYDFLPPPPQTGSLEWLVDMKCYWWGKNVCKTDSVRLSIAIRDANLHEGLATSFNEVFPFEISRDSCPSIFYVITHAREDAGSLATKGAKDGYLRKRPFEELYEHTPIPDVEDEFRGTGSYPSGHAAIGWLTALILSEIAPEYTSQIMRRGYEIGQSRVILGFHFQSDEDAGRLLASMVYPILHNNAEFMADLEAAKAEYKRIMEANFTNVQ